jgi:hypothetical protein
MLVRTRPRRGVTQATLRLDRRAEEVDSRAAASVPVGRVRRFTHKLTGEVRGARAAPLSSRGRLKWAETLRTRASRQDKDR